MESMDTTPLGTFVLMQVVLLELRGDGALNADFAEEEVEEEQGGEDCAGGRVVERGRS